MEKLPNKDCSRPSNRRRGPSRLLLVLQGAVILVMALILAISLIFLNQTRRELSELQVEIGALRKGRSSSPAPVHPADAGPSAEELRKWIAALRSEIADGRATATQALAASRTEAARDRTALRVTLAQILGARGATSDEMAALLEPLSPAERRQLLSELDLLESGDQENGSGEPSGVPEAGEGPEAPPSSPGATDPMDHEPPPSPSETALISEDVPSPSDPEEASPPPDSPTAGTSEEQSSPPMAPLAGPDEAPDPDGEAPDPDEEVVVYTVRRGDTVSAIALKFKVSEQAILTANKITNPRVIQIGQKLVIPGV